MLDGGVEGGVGEASTEVVDVGEGAGRVAVARDAEGGGEPGKLAVKPKWGEERRSESEGKGDGKGRREAHLAWSEYGVPSWG